MNTKATNIFKNTVFETQMRILMTIKNFRQDFIDHSAKIKGITQDLIATYEEAAEFLKANGNPDYLKESAENLNEIMVQANQMNNVLEISDDYMIKTEEKRDFKADEKEFKSRKDRLKEASLKFENLGTKALSDEFLNTWNSRYVVYENRFENELENESKYVNLIYDFENKYTQDDLEKITGIVLETTSEEVNWDDPAEYEKQYIKAISEFQREFKPQNLWDTMMEILAGGVHPSPSERMMLEQWSDGEQKTREDM